MIVLLVSANEAQALAAGEPDRALSRYILRELSLEKLLPDDNLPVAVLLREVGFDVECRHYVAVGRTYATTEDAERAWSTELIRLQDKRRSERPIAVKKAKKSA